MSIDFQLKSAAHWTKGLPHQNDAWDWLQSTLNKETLEEFKLRYRNEKRIESIVPQYRIPIQAVNIIQHFEDIHLKPYLCPARIPTIGWGTTVYPNGSKVKLTDPPITKVQADQYFNHYLEQRILPVLSKTIPYWNSMNNNQRSALISFAYNLGENFMTASSGFTTIQRNLKNKEWDKIPVTLLMYKNPGTPSEPGLLRRRKEEGLLWNSQGKYAVN